VAIVLLHGFAGTPAAWEDVAIAGARAIALPGHGRSAAGSWDAALDDVAARVERDAIVIGYSLGARVALGLLARDAIAAAILISVNPGIDDDARAQRRADDARWASHIRADLPAFLDEWEAQPLFATASRADTARRARRRATRGTLVPAELARALETMSLAAMPDYRDALASRADRAHLVAGADDPKFAAIAAAAAARSPSLGLDVLDGVGHDPTLEAPERLAPVLARALARLHASVTSIDG
jgi:2-succinyl-6-hydroxy-2,4-cyclohexadiene-1-carboxylate synthase